MHGVGADKDPVRVALLVALGDQLFDWAVTFCGHLKGVVWVDLGVL